MENKYLVNSKQKNERHANHCEGQVRCRSVLKRQVRLPGVGCVCRRGQGNVSQLPSQARTKIQLFETTGSIRLCEASPPQISKVTNIQLKKWYHTAETRNIGRRFSCMLDPVFLGLIKIFSLSVQDLERRTSTVIVFPWGRHTLTKTWTGASAPAAPAAKCKRGGCKKGGFKIWA